MTILAKFPTSAVPSGGPVSELVIEDRLDALNRCLDEHGVPASKILAIFRIPAQPIANAAPARLRVLYRAN
jgi:hypothetical protein